MKPWIASCAALIWVLAVAASPAGAAEPEADDAGTYEEVAGEEGGGGYRTVVTPSGVQVPIVEEPRSVHILTQSALLRLQPQDPGAAVDALPGVQTQRTNRGAATPMLRGFTGPQNLLVVDGVRFNQSTFRTGPNQYGAFVDTLALEQIEVLLGAGSVLYGSDAMGGVIQMRTFALPTDEGIFLRGLARFATEDLGLTLGATVGGRAGPVSGWVGGSFRRHDTLRTGGGHAVPESGFMRGDWRGKVGFDLGDHWRLTATILGVRMEGATRVDSLPRGDLRRYNNHDDLAILSLTRTERGALVDDMALTLSYHRVDEQITRFSCGTTAAGGIADEAACIAEDRTTAVTRVRGYHDTTHAMGLRAQVGLRLLEGDVRLIAGFDGRLDVVESAQTDARATDGFVETASPRGNFSDGSLYGGADIFLMARGVAYEDPGVFKLILQGGARVSHTEARAGDVPGLGDVSFSATGVTFQASVQAVVRERFSLYATWAQGFRTPNLQEATVLGDTGSTFEVPGDVGAERSDTIELGIKVEDDVVRVGAAFFHTEVSDAIVGVPGQYEGADAVDGKPVRVLINADSARYQGGELSLALMPGEGFTLYGNASVVLGEVQRADGSSESARRVPPAQGRVGLRWTAPWLGFFADLGTRWAAPQNVLSPGDRTDLRICTDPAQPWETLGADCTGSPGWATLDLRLGVEPIDGLRIDAAVTNLLDTAYRVHASGFNAPGVGGTLSISGEL